MATILRMPEVLANATEAVLATWIVEEGRPFRAGDTLAEVETEKALIDLPAEHDGILGRLLAAPGESTAVGAPIAVLIVAGETDADIDRALGVIGAGEVRGGSADEVRGGDGGEVRADEVGGGDAGEVRGGSADVQVSVRTFASPIARRLVKENGLDLASISGTGPGGRIVRRDVQHALKLASATAAVPGATVPASSDVLAPAVAASGVPVPAPSGVPAPVATPTAPGHFTEIPHTPMRLAIARRLTESKATVPHFYLTAECVVDDLLALRRQINASSAIKVSVNDLVVKAVAAAFADVPEANVTWTPTHLRQYDSADISVAVATDRGLVTPVVRGVEALTITSLSTTIRELVDRARAGRLRQPELEGGSFSVTNLGMFGTTEFAAILNPPQSGILAIGAAKPQAAVIDGLLTVATVMRCTLSVDHRAIDGALAARWLAAFEARIANPVSILI